MKKLNQLIEKNQVTAIFNIGVAMFFSILTFPARADTIPSYKLLVDNGRYQESSWVRQLAVTDDDKYLLVSDVSSGVRIYDVETGELNNSFEGHSLDGDIYFDKINNLLVTTGDKKIKIWDITTQALVMQINQAFHSQFMNNVYIDSKKKYLFAEKIKYDFKTMGLLKKYSFTKMLFFKDKYYIFDKKQGTIEGYSVYDDKLVNSTRIENYKKGYNEFFNEQKGILIIGYSNGITSVDITTGKSETILFDRSNTFDNLNICSNYDYSYDKTFFIASSNQGKDARYGGHFVILKKNRLTGLYEEVFRELNQSDEIVALNKSHRCIVSTNNSLQLFDYDNLKPVWNKSESIQKIENIYTSKDAKYMNLKFGTEYFHLIDIRQAAGTNYNTDYVNKYFDLKDANIENSYGWGKFKSNLTDADITEELNKLWKNSKRYYTINPIQGFKGIKTINESNLLKKGSEATPYSPIEGKVFSPSGFIYASEKSFEGVTFYKNDTKIVMAPTSGVIYHIEYSEDEKYAAFGGSDRIVTVVDLVQKKKLFALPGNSYITSICFSRDNKYVFSGSLKNEIPMHDVITGKLIRKFNGSNGSILDLEISGNNKMLISAADDNALRFWDIQSGKLLLTTYYDYEFNYISFTPDGYFDKSEIFEGSMSWNYNGTVIKFDQLFDTYYRPDLIRSILNSEDVKEQSKPSIAKGINTPPEVTLKIKRGEEDKRGLIIENISPSDPITQNRVLANVTVKNTGGGIKGVRLYNNDKLVGEKTVELSASIDSTFLIREFVVDLSNGVNKLRAIGFSKDMTESKGATIELSYKSSQIEKPNMYVIAIGINKYKNPKYNLNFCVADMQGFSDALTLISRDLFNKVYVTTISDEDATKEKVIKVFNDYSEKIKPNDVFTFFYAGHGIALDANNNPDNLTTEFYYVLRDVIQITDISKTSDNGISGTEMRQMLAKIKANKQLLFIDACNSGAFAEQFKKRGAAEENALAKLSRATGSTVFASSTKDQFASEFEQLKHGVFTYVLIQALSGEASLNNCQITAASIKSFVDDNIPIYTEKFNGQAQYPTTFMWGQDFPLGIKCKNK